MSKSHNKKRNVGIIYEQIINYVTDSLMNKDEKKAEEAISLIRKHFKKDTQLFKEYKLFKALVTTSNISEQLASSIINEAKRACNNMFDSKELEREKSSLIKDLNYTLGKGVIFEQKIKKYREYATIQTLLNEWRKPDSDFSKTTEYEIKLHESLTRNKQSETVALPKVDKLTRKIMKSMFEKKYNSQLNESQKEMISYFISDDKKSLERKFLSTKSSCKALFENYMRETNNAVLLEKKKDVFAKLSSIDEKEMSKENLQRFLTLAKLNEELKG